jgi:hypothetical protein
MKGSLIRLPLHRTRCHRTDHLSLHFHMTTAMMPCAPPVVAPSPVLRKKLWNPSSTCFMMKQAVGCQRVSSHRINLLNAFESQTDKPPPTWFWGTNQETVIVILRPKSPNRRHWIWGPNKEIVTVVLRSNHWQIIITSFEVKPENPRFSSPTCVRCKSHMTSLDLPIVWPPSIWLVPNHPWSSAPSLLLLSRSSSLPIMSHSPPTHHETNKCVSPHRITQYRLVQPKCAEFIFKLEQVNYSSHI